MGPLGRAVLAPRRPSSDDVPHPLPECQLHHLPVQQAHRLRRRHARPEHRDHADRHGGPDRRHGPGRVSRTARWRAAASRTTTA
ncbi:MAG: hypothetical protein MZV64_63920 [Ignavibacteriales bacterium]|nr:hypothetical protein [Ignavibacteriales bacterium]